jgi:hypothetical protein
MKCVCVCVYGERDMMHVERQKTENESPENRRRWNDSIKTDFIKQSVKVWTGLNSGHDKVQFQSLMNTGMNL